jgi:acyl-ACP thioesterase
MLMAPWRERSVMNDDAIQPEWRTEHLIRSYDVDPGCRVRLPVLCRFMQEAAYFHAEHLGVGHSHLSPLKMSWVLSRMRIDVHRLPRWGDSVFIRTWPSGRDRLFYYRDFEIMDGEGAVILLASTAWFVIDTEKRERLTPDWWKTADYPFSPGVIDSKPARLKGDAGGSGITFRVRYGDLDQNGHVNNVRYLEWMLDALPMEFHQANDLRSLEVNYLAEAVYGHELQMRACETEPGTFVHSAGTNSLELFRAVSVWRPLPT